MVPLPEAVVETPVPKVGICPTGVPVAVDSTGTVVAAAVAH